MPVFSYRSTTRDGVTADGSIEAPDEKAAVEQLRTSGLIPLEVRLPRESWRMPLRVKTGQAEGMETVAQLLESARKGQLAGSTALQSRQALTSAHRSGPKRVFHSATVSRRTLRPSGTFARASCGGSGNASSQARQMAWR